MLANPPNRVSVVIAGRAVARVKPAEGGEGGIVKATSHPEAEQQPADQKDRQNRREGQRRQSGRQEQRRRCQHRAPAVAVNRFADMRRGEGGYEEAERQAADHPGQRPAVLSATGRASTAGR